MPLYDFRCADCRCEREVRVPLPSGASLELVCLNCGGSMTKALTRTVSLISRPDREPRRPAATSATHSCSDGAVELERPNPFARSLPVNRTANDSEADG